MRYLLNITAIGVCMTLLACSDSSTLDIESNQPPAISGLADVTVTANSDMNELSFTVNDDRTAAGSLLVTASVDSPGLFSDDGVVVDGSGEQRSLVLTPVAGQTGQASVTLSVADAAGLTSEATVVVVVAPQPVAFNDIARSAFAADENADPVSIKDKEFDNDASDFSDLLLE